MVRAVELDQRSVVQREPAANRGSAPQVSERVERSQLRRLARPFVHGLCVFSCNVRAAVDVDVGVAVAIAIAVAVAATVAVTGAQPAALTYAPLLVVCDMARLFRGLNERPPLLPKRRLFPAIAFIGEADTRTRRRGVSSSRLVIYGGYVRVFCAMTSWLSCSRSSLPVSCVAGACNCECEGFVVAGTMLPLRCVTCGSSC